MEIVFVPCPSRLTGQQREESMDVYKLLPDENIKNSIKGQRKERKTGPLSRLLWREWRLP